MPLQKKQQEDQKTNPISKALLHVRKNNGEEQNIPE
jgi:hypothetical protein